MRSFVLGVNYWPRRSSLAMWRRWSADEVREDLRKIRELGFEAIRFFILLRDFVDPDLGIREDSLKKLSEFIDIAEEIGLKLFPTLLTIHMSGWNWFNPLSSESIYSLRTAYRFASFARRIVELLRGRRSIVAWVITNEFSNVEDPRDRELYRALAEFVATSIKMVDSSRPVVFGDLVGYAREPENFPTNADYVGLHLYYYDNDVTRHGLAYAFWIERYRAIGKPVILEEFGCSTYVFSEESHARFVNAVLYTALANEAIGAFIWCYADYIEEAEPLLNNHPYELGFGIVRKDGSEKPVTEVIKSFAYALQKLRELRFFEKYTRIARDTVIVVPSHLTRGAPFILPMQELQEPAILESFVIAKGAKLCPIPVPEDMLIHGKAIMVPSIQILKASTWRKLLDYASRGSLVYFSILRTSREAHKGACHLWRELFGVEPLLEAGSIGMEIGDRVRIEFVERFGLIEPGKTIEINIGRRIDVSRVFIPRFRAVKAKVLALVDGEPAIFPNRVGDGYAVLSTVPIELLVASNHSIDRESIRGVYELYRSMAMVVGANTTFDTIYPIEVEIEKFISSTGEECIYVAVNHSLKTINIELKRGRIVAGWNYRAHEYSDKLTIELHPRGSCIIYTA